MKKYLPKINREPIFREINLNCSIEDVYSHFSSFSNTAFLNSSLKSDKARYSFIGVCPFMIITSKRDQIQLRLTDRNASIQMNPFECLESILKTYKIISPEYLPFAGGGIGYFSYDLKDHLEELPEVAKDDLDLPDMYFTFYRAILIHDALSPDKLLISALEIDSHRESSEDLIKEIILAVRSAGAKFALKEKITPAAREFSLESNFSKKDYIHSIRTIIKHIRAGNIYQACLAQRFKTGLPYPAYELYQKLNRINPAPFSAYLNFDDCKIISSSPELFLHIENNKIETRPMKGTRPRGNTAREDAFLKEALAESAKDTAELLMIVDLERNDLGKISIPGSVNVAELRRLETHPTVFQTISVIKSKMTANSNPINVLKAAFPGGSISGCPKIRAMKIIEELEPTKRGIYTGAIGYISFHDTMNLNIAIRTMIVKNDDVYFHAGGGITAYSDPEKEYEETLVKAKALIDSLSIDANTNYVN